MGPDFSKMRQALIWCFVLSGALAFKQDMDAPLPRHWESTENGAFEFPETAGATVSSR